MVIFLQILTQKKSIQNTASDYDFFNLLGQFNPFSIKFDNKKRRKRKKVEQSGHYHLVEM